jgi:hypothetical protein
VITGAPAVALPGGAQLTSANAVKLLLSDVYRSVPDPKQQDVVFAAAARGVFGALTGASSNQAVAGLRRAAGEGRVRVWSASTAEQQTLASMTLSGSIDGAAAARVGVYLNDGTGAKMDYYLREAIRLEPVACVGGQASKARLTLTLRSTAPATGLPAYVTGGGAFGVPVGTVRTNVLILAPAGAGIGGATADGIGVAFGSGAEHGRQIAVVRLDIAAGQQRVVTVELSGLTRTPGVDVGAAAKTIIPAHTDCAATLGK